MAASRNSRIAGFGLLDQSHPILQRSLGAACSIFFSATAGFSLVELVVALAIAAIVAAIAYPSYTNSVYKSRRAEGRVLLESVAAAQERYYNNRNKYTSATGSDGLATPVESEPGHFYTLAKIELGDNEQTFTLIAQPQGAQAGDPCASLTLESSGRRGIRSAASDVPDNCW